MRLKYLLLLLIGFSFHAYSQVTYPNITDLPLSDMISQIEVNHNVSFSYNDEYIQENNITVNKGTYNLERILNIVFSQTKLNFEKIDETHYIIKKSPTFEILICGTIIDKVSHQPIAFANIFTDDLSTITSSDEQGQFEMTISTNLKYYTVTYLGYNVVKIAINKQKPCEKIQLVPSTVALKEIVLIEYLADGISQPSDESTIVIQPDAMSIMPGSVDKDVMSTIQFLPGISSPIESFDDINVRGGTPDQNLILWDHIPVYQTSHFFGNISALNPFIIDHVDVYRSTIDTKFGGRVSSVIDVTSRDDIPISFTIGAGFNLTHAHLEIGTPLWKNSALWISTRRSITDLYNTPTFLSYAKKVFQGTKVEDVKFNNKVGDKFLFNDGNVKWKWKIGTNTFQISTLGALNNLNFNTNLPEINIRTTDNLKLSSGGVSFKWSKDITRNLAAEFILASSTYTNDYRLNTSQVDTTVSLPFYISTTNKLEDGSSQLNFKYSINEFQKTNFGYQFSNNNIDFRIGANDLNMITTGDSLDFKNKSHTIYGEYQIEVPNMLKFDVGLRYVKNITLQKDYFEPRISATTKITDDLKLKVGTSKHFQFINQLVVFDANNIGISNKIWIAADNATIPVIESNQWMGGLLYQKNGWTIDLEGYVKELRGLTSLSSDLEGQPFSTGDSRIRGLDLLIKKKFNNYRSWLSYTLSESLYEFPQISILPFSASHDQTHNLQWVHLYKIKAWEFSLGLQLRSGLPNTKAEGIGSKVNNDGRTVSFIEFGVIHGNRLKPYFRLDASVVYNFEIKELFSGYLGFSIQNFSNYKNISDEKNILKDNENQNFEIIKLEQYGLRLTPNLTANILF